MKYEDLSIEQAYSYDVAWENLRLAFKMLEQKRKAKAQEYLLEVRYYAAKVPTKFTDQELSENIEKLQNQIIYGF